MRSLVLTQVAEATVQSRRAEAAPVETVAVSVVGTLTLSPAVHPEMTPGTTC